MGQAELQFRPVSVWVGWEVGEEGGKWEVDDGKSRGCGASAETSVMQTCKRSEAKTVTGHRLGVASQRR